VIALHDAANLRNPCSGKFALQQGAQHEENDSEGTDRERTGKEPQWLGLVAVFVLGDLCEAALISVGSDPPAGKCIWSRKKIVRTK
jgi:hypothetical protein